MITIYHNSRCSKSRLGVEFLKSKGLEFETVEYLKAPLTTAVLTELISRIGIEPFELIRTNEAIFKSEFKGKNLTDAEWVEVMIANPKLIERPIIDNGLKAVIGRPAEKIEELI